MAGVQGVRERGQKEPERAEGTGAASGSDRMDCGRWGWTPKSGQRCCWPDCRGRDSWVVSKSGWKQLSRSGPALSLEPLVHDAHFTVKERLNQVRSPTHQAEWKQIRTGHRLSADLVPGSPGLPAMPPGPAGPQ